jgi:peptide/nickel transport system substrate-binding protein
MPDDLLLRLDPVTRRTLLQRSTAFAGVAAVGGVLSACGRSAEPSTSKGPKTSLVYVDTDTPATFDLDQPGADGLAERLSAAVYGGGMLRYKVVEDEGMPVADVSSADLSGLDNGFCEKFEISDDQREFTFHLRDDVKSSLGNTLTAADIVWSFQRAVALKQTGAFFASVMGIDGKNVVAVDERTVKITTKDPHPVLPRVETMRYYGAIIDSTAAKENATSDDPWAKDWLRSNTAGFDAYSVKTFRKGVGMTLEANPGWVGGKPAFPTVQWKAVPSGANRLGMLLRGDADAALGLTPPQLKQAAATKGVTVTSYRANHIRSLQLNTTSKPLGDARVRRAIAYAMPYDEILKSVYFDTAELVKTPLPSMYPGSTDEYWEYQTNLDKARSLLKEAGVGSFKMNVLFNQAEYDSPLLANIIKAALGDLGIDVTLESLPTSVFVERSTTGKGDSFIQLNYPFISDPAYALGVYWKSDSFLNSGKWKNAKFDQLVDKMAVELNTDKRLALAGQAQQIWEQEQPWVGLANPGWHVAHRSNIGNVVWYPDNGIRFQELKPV